jgi:hypothetical protein
MPSHAPLCGINRPHVRHWSRTNRIDPILELPPVTSDTVTVPPPTRSPEPKVTRYIVIRNDQHDGSSHHGKIFIVAGNRPAAAHLPGKATITFRNHSAHQGSTAPGSAPASPSRPADFSGLARPECTTHLGASPTPDLSGYEAVGPGRPQRSPSIRRAPGRIVASAGGAQPFVGHLRQGRPAGWSTAYTVGTPSRLVDGLPNRREEGLLLPSP